MVTVSIFSTDFDGKMCFVQVKKMGDILRFFETFLRVIITAILYFPELPIR